MTSITSSARPVAIGVLERAARVDGRRSVAATAALLRRDSSRAWPARSAARLARATSTDGSASSIHTCSGMPTAPQRAGDAIEAALEPLARLGLGVPDVDHGDDLRRHVADHEVDALAADAAHPFGVRIALRDVMKRATGTWARIM